MNRSIVSLVHLSASCGGENIIITDCISVRDCRGLENREIVETLLLVRKRRLGIHQVKSVCLIIIVLYTLEKRLESGGSRNQNRY